MPGIYNWVYVTEVYRTKRLLLWNKIMNETYSV